MRLNFYVSVIISSVFLVSSQLLASVACEEFHSYADTDIDNFFSVLEDLSQKERDRYRAYKALSCSDDPVFRQEASKIGLEEPPGSMIRSRILTDLIMGRDAIVVKLKEDSNLSELGKDYFEEKNGQLKFQVFYRDVDQGCMSLYGRDQCSPSYQSTVKGNKVEVIYGEFHGEFILTEENKLVGYVIPDIPRIGKIFAEIEFF